MKKKILFPAIAAGVVVLFGAYVFLAPMLKGGFHDGADIYVDNDDNSDSVSVQLKACARWPQRWGVSLLAAMTKYDKHPRTGHYTLAKGESALGFFRAIRGGRQTPVKLTIPTVRTMEDLAGYLGRSLMLDSAEFLSAVKSQPRMEALGVDTANAYCLFIPDTYEIYWNISLDKFFKKMKSESEMFWTPQRRAKAKAIPLTTNEVYTLASIVDEETANNAEKPMIAGMYINRLHAGMPLQADPTIKFAWRRFSLRRIYHDLLFIDSPYNTYRHAGLPVGPIRIASVAGIDAVLNYVHHDYKYMCAKEDFSGTHNFAKTYAEHLKNAEKYTQALDRRGIK